MEAEGQQTENGQQGRDQQAEQKMQNAGGRNFSAPSLTFPASASVGATVAVPPSSSCAGADMQQQQPAPYFHKCGRVMTDEQFEILRRQISVYSTICSQLVEMHKAVIAQQALMPSVLVGQQLSFDPLLGARSTGRQRWTPSQTQLQILENMFESSNGTPSKQKIKEITADLGQHGQISETNVYNWFQNRKARAKRKQQSLTLKDGDSEMDMDEVESRKDKRAALEMFNENGGFWKCDNSSFAVDPCYGGSMPMPTNHMLETPGMHNLAYTEEGFAHRSGRGIGTTVVLIDGKPWEVPSGTLDLRGSFGEGSALLDSQRQLVPIDETGFTICPLRAGESYSLIKHDSSIPSLADMVP